MMLSSRLPLVWGAVSAVALVALVAVVFLSVTLAANLSGMATYLIMLGVSAVLATVVAVPSALVNKSDLGSKRPV